MLPSRLERECSAREFIELVEFHKLSNEPSPKLADMPVQEQLLKVFGGPNGR